MPKKPSASLITNKSNIAYLSNFTGSSGFMLLTRSKSYLFTDSRYILRAKNSIKKGIEIVDTSKMWRNPKELKKGWQSILKKHRITTLGIEESDLTVLKMKKFKKISPKVKFQDISFSIEKTREIKEKNEIKLIRKSQKINEKVFSTIKKIVQTSRKNKKKITELNLAWKIKELGNKYGAEDMSFDPIVAFGTNSAIVHHAPSNKVLKKTDIILIDMGMKYQGYCSDMSRMILPENPSKKHLEVYGVVLKAQTEAIKQIKAGISGKKADAISRNIIKEAGYGDYYNHAGGHGIGLDVHESPSLSENYSKKLKTSSIVTVEPGIYIPGEFGVRIEDMILIKEKGVKNLTKMSK